MSQLFLFVVSERAAVLFSSAALAQIDEMPKTDKNYGVEVARDQATQLFVNTDYPLSTKRRRNGIHYDIDGARPDRTVADPGHRHNRWWGAFSATLRPTVPASSYVIGEFRANGFDGQIFLRLIQRLGRKAGNPGYTTFNSKKIGAAFASIRSRQQNDDGEVWTPETPAER
jgi:hypothetical protein